MGGSRCYVGRKNIIKNKDSVELSLSSTQFLFAVFNFKERSFYLATL